MQFVFLAGFLILSGASAFDASPVTKVVTLITNLQKKIEQDGKTELAAFDKYACWCEAQLKTKNSEIATAKTTIDDLQALMTKLGGELASHNADVKQNTKDLAENKASQNEAKAMRAKEFQDYSKERTDAEQSIGALESAIKTMTAGTVTKTRFLQTLQQAEVLSTVGSLRSVLDMPVIATMLSPSDLDVVKRFIDKPDDFSTSAGTMSAMQVDSEVDSDAQGNPAGDYAPASAQIQGILKSMYDGLTSSLEGDNAQEAKMQKSYEDLLADKIAEAATISATLARATADAAEKSKKKADSKNTRDDTKEQLDADEKFVALTTKAKAAKDDAWSLRTRLRIEELQGMQAAVDILSSTKAKSTFTKAATTFLQISANAENKAALHLQKLATEYGIVSLFEVASEVRTGGHFDRVIAMVDGMVAKLKEEGAKDIRLRDRCETNQGKNKAKMEDLTASIANFKAIIKRKNANKNELKAKAAKALVDMTASQKTIADMNSQRSTEQAAYVQARKDDNEGIAMLKKAIASMNKFYTDNGIKMTNLLEAVEDADATPGGGQSGDEYGGQKSASTGILTMLAMIQEDLEQEVKDGDNNNKDAIIEFNDGLKSVQTAMDTQEKTKADADSAVAEVKRQIVYKEADTTELQTDLAGEKDVETAVAEDCDWIKTDFKKRSEKRDLETSGLVEAKSFLKGASVPPSARR